jgi:hypothetical protein
MSSTTYSHCSISLIAVFLWSPILYIQAVPKKFHFCTFHMFIVSFIQNTFTSLPHLTDAFDAIFCICNLTWVAFVCRNIILSYHYYLKIKEKLSSCFNWAPRHEGVLGEWMYSSTHSLSSALDAGEWSASRPYHFTPREKAPGTHWIGGRVDPRAFLDAVVKRNSQPPPRIEP